MINYGKQYIDDDDIKAVVDVLKSDFLTTGPKVAEFETIIKEKYNYKHAVAVNSGSAALLLSLMCLELKPGDEVIVPSITFVATANVVEMCGATPIFADIEFNSLLIDWTDVDKKVTKNTKAIIAVDMAGELCNYTMLKNICLTHNLALIADSCHSLGVGYNPGMASKPDFKCFSFHPVKTITTGEGGMILTDNYQYYLFMKQIRHHGMNKEKAMVELGFNYRLSDINCALGISQFKKIDRFVNKRKRLREFYEGRIDSKHLFELYNESSYHLMMIRANNRQTVINHLKKNLIGTQIHYKPVYDQPYYYMKYAYRTGENLNEIVNCPNTEKIKDKILSIPLYYELNESNIYFISLKINEVIE